MCPDLKLHTGWFTSSRLDWGAKVWWQSGLGSHDLVPEEGHLEGGHGPFLSQFQPWALHFFAASSLGIQPSLEVNA